MNIEANQKPLLTLALFAYNQEKFIREAVKGALSQDYSPLEIIVSDDSSTDATWAIIQEEVSNYSGFHIVRSRRNVTNKGLIPHVVEVMTLAEGDFIVVAAGDDVSFSNRVSTLYSEWVRSGASCVFSNAINMDAESRVFGLYSRITSPYQIASPYRSTGTTRFLALGAAWIMGCSAAYSKALILNFPPMREGILTEDVVLAFRALLTNGISYVPDPLLYYRRHHANLFNHTDPGYLDRLRKLRKWRHGNVQLATQQCSDFEHLPDHDPQILDELRRLRLMHQCEADLCDDRGMKWVKTLLKRFKVGGFSLYDSSASIPRRVFRTLRLRIVWSIFTTYFPEYFLATFLKL